MERFVIIVNGFHPFTIITKHSILDVAAALDPPLDILEDKTNMLKLWKNIAHSVHFQRKIRNKIWQWLLFLLLLIPMVKKNLPNLANNFHSPILPQNNCKICFIDDMNKHMVEVTKFSFLFLVIKVIHNNYFITIRIYRYIK